MTNAQPTAPAPPDLPPLLEAAGIRVHFPIRDGLFSTRQIRAVDGVDLTIARGETLGLVGESGSGKSTVGRAIVQIERLTAGEIKLDGTSLGHLSGRALRHVRRRFQMIFQDPQSSLNPRHRIVDIIAEPLIIQGVSRESAKATANELLGLVGLDVGIGRRYPHTLSGGQSQRVAVARALSSKPDLIVCDEPVSALDVSTQAQLINLLEDLNRRLHLALLFIAHDLAVVRQISDRVAVMYLGKIVEIGDVPTIYSRPLHPYTLALLSAVPVRDAEKRSARPRIVLTGEMPSPANPPSGCRFRTRCPWAAPVCAEIEPPLQLVDGRQVACHFAGKIDINTARSANSVS